MRVYSEGEERHIAVRGFAPASSLGAYLSTVKAFGGSNDTDLLQPFVGQSVTDADGTIHPFETNPNILHRLLHSGSEPFHDIYRLIF